VKNAFGVRRRQARRDLASDGERLLEREAANAPDEGGQVLAVHVLHGEEVDTVRLAHVVHAADRGVSDLAGDADLVEEAFPARGVHLERGWQEL
jgi:hypothetical protein